MQGEHEDSFPDSSRTAPRVMNSLLPPPPASSSRRPSSSSSSMDRVVAAGGGVHDHALEETGGSAAAVGNHSPLPLPPPPRLPLPASPTLRHRHHHHHHHQNQHQQRHQHPQFRTSHMSPIYGSHSLDDADAAAGLRAVPQQPPPRRAMLTSSRSWGSKTPEKQNNKVGSWDNGNNDFASPHNYSIRSAPHMEQRREDDLRGFGNSEHDFLLLASAASSIRGDDDEDYDNTSCSSDGMRQRLLAPNPRGMRPMPPLEITTTDGRLPSIEGSPADANDRYARKMGLPPDNHNRGHNNGHNNNPIGAIPKPPLADETSVPPKGSKFVVLGWDLSSHTRRDQFLISASGTFLFSLLYGYLQELISVELCHRKLGLFLALAQFAGYTAMSYFFRKLEKGAGAGGGGAGAGGRGKFSLSRRLRRVKNWGRLRRKFAAPDGDSTDGKRADKTVPPELYIGLSVLRAIDLGMTNLAMQYVNYPAKTLMKSTRVVFTMIFGVICLKKRYGVADYSIVCLMVAGLGMFMHADAHTSAVFQPLGIVMLVVSLLCDGAVSNFSEALMNRYDVGQDEFIFRLYSVATLFICVAAAAKGDLRDGIAYLASPGTMHEMEEGLTPTWTAVGKITVMALFSITGFLGSSCSAAITKSFGALTMSIASTARKATTIFLSFALFPNECTMEHVGGIFLFIASLVAKSLRASKRGAGGGGGRRHHDHHHHGDHRHRKHLRNALESSGGIADALNGNSACSPLQLRRKALGDDAV